MREEHAGGEWGGGVGRQQAPQGHVHGPEYDLDVDQYAPQAERGPRHVRIGEPLPRRRMAWWPNVDVVLASVCVASCIVTALLTHQSAYWLAALMAANWWLRTKWS